MSHRASLFLSLVLLSTSACTSSAPTESHVGERLEKFTRRTKGEVRAAKRRHQDRERLRALGKRVCEEGDWPQYWKEGCRSCWCDVGDVRSCNLRLACPAAERGPEPGTPTSTANVESVAGQVGKRLEKLTRRTMREVSIKAIRHEHRERLRAAGARVCEEGDWPQEWWDGCQWCGCDVGEVRVCETANECNPEVERKMRQHAAQDALENPHRVRKQPISPRAPPAGP